MLPPSGGSSWTETTHSPSRSARARPVSRCSSPRATDQLALLEVERRARLALLLDGRADRGDLHRRRPAAAADDPRAELAGVRGELGEVLGRRVRVDHAAAGKAREADVRQRRERLAAVHLLERGERGEQAGAVVGAEGGDVELRRAAAPPPARSTPASVSAPSSKVSSATIGSAETSRTALDGVDELLEVVERLDHEEVGAAALEDATPARRRARAARASSPARRAARSSRR